MRVLPRAVLLAGVWVVLADGAPASWLIGAPAVAAATWVSAALSDPRRGTLKVGGLAAFVPYFIRRSMTGSIDVAARVLHPRLPIDPGFETYPLRLPADGPARILFADAVSLLPGTLSADLHDDRIVVHRLAGTSARVRADLEALERRVAAVFGAPLAPLDAREL